MNSNEIALKKDKYQKLIPVFRIVFVLLVVLFLGLLFIKETTYSTICLILAIVTYFVIESLKKKEASFNESLKTTLLEEVFNKYLQDFSYVKESGLSYKEIQETELAYGNIYSSNDTIRASYKEKAIVISDVNILESLPVSQGADKVLPKFIGLLIKIDNPYELKGNLKVSETVEEFLLSNYKKVEMESLIFNEKFKVYANHEIDAFYALKPQIMEKIEKIEADFNGNFTFNFIKNSLYIGLNDFNDTFSVKDYKNFDLEQVKKDFEDQLKDILSFIDIFN